VRTPQLHLSRTCSCRSKGRTPLTFSATSALRPGGGAPSAGLPFCNPGAL